MIDAAAAAGDGDAHAGLNAAGDNVPGELLGHGLSDLVGGDMAFVIALADLDHLGNGDIFDEVGNGFHG